MHRLKQRSNKSTVSTEVKLTTARTWAVEKVIDHRGERGLGGNIEYLVKWQDYPDDANSWEPPYSLKDCPEAIEEYWKVQRQVQRQLQHYDSRPKRHETYQSKKAASENFQKLKEYLSGIVMRCSSK